MPPAVTRNKEKRLILRRKILFPKKINKCKKLGKLSSKVSEEVNTWYIIVQSFITWSYGEWARVQIEEKCSLFLILLVLYNSTIFLTFLLSILIKKKETLITKSVKNHSFLLSLNWTVSGIYGDQCYSLIEILSPWFFYLSQTYTSHISFLTTSKLITILARSVKYVKFLWFKRFF